MGSHVVRKLVEQGVEVFALVRPGSDQSRLAGYGAKVYEVDITDAEALRVVFTAADKPTVLHLAASNIMSGTAASAKTLAMTNIVATDALLALSVEAQASGFISVGSFLEYGPKQEAVREDMRCDAPEIYSITKLAGSLSVQAAGVSGKLPAVVFRLFTPYGPQIQEGRLVREVIRKALTGEPISLTRPTVTRDFIYVEDAAELLIEAASAASKHSGQIYNLGSGRKTSLEELANVVLEQTGSASPLSWGSFGSVSYDADTWQADMSKTFAAFSWRPKHDLEAGIAKTISWLKESQ